MVCSSHRLTHSIIRSFISLTGQWKKYLGEHQVLVYPMCVVSVELGNKLGNYFNEVACAEQSGMHFLAMNKQWHLVDDAHSSSINPNHTEHDR